MSVFLACVLDLQEVLDLQIDTPSFRCVVFRFGLHVGILLGLAVQLTRYFE